MPNMAMAMAEADVVLQVEEEGEIKQLTHIQSSTMLQSRSIWDRMATGPRDR